MARSGAGVRGGRLWRLTSACKLLEQALRSGAAEDAKSMQAVGVVGATGPARHDGRRAGVAGGLHGCYDRGVVVAGGVAEPVHGDVEAPLKSAARDRDLVAELL